MNTVQLCCLLILFSGCAVSGTLPNLSGSASASVESGKDDFIELFDGTVITGTIKEAGNKGLIVAGKTYHVKNIKTYQYKSQYRSTVKNRFVTRIVKGRINVYMRNIYYGYNMSGGYNAGTGTSYYLQKGDKSPIEYFDVKTLEEMVSDNLKALDWVKQYKVKKNDAYLDYAIQAYNSDLGK
jgi:hypothetical protein